MDEKNEMELEKYKLLKTGRYYALEDDITIKCHNCGDVGHIKDYCPYINLKFCHRCLSNNHNDKDCRNKKCFRCNRSGHNMKECDIKDSDIILCFNCQNSGHRKNECLIKPTYIESKLLKNNGLSCFSCGSNKHLICPLSTRNNIELKEENINIEDDKEDNENSSSNYIYFIEEGTVELTSTKSIIEIQLLLKGLGEMSTESFSDTVMNKDKRKLKQITINNIHDTLKWFEELMGKDVTGRKDFLENNAQYAQIDI